MIVNQYPICMMGQISYKLVYIALFILCSWNSIASEEPKQNFSLTEAIAFTLDNQLGLQISELNYEAQKGVVRNAAGPFDPVFDGDTQYTEFIHIQCPVLNIRTDKIGHQLTGFVGARKKYRLGTIVSLSADVDQVDNFCFFPRPTNIGTITFRLEQPLLRDFMWSLDTVNEIAAKLELQAVYFDNLQTISEQILDTTVQYWRVVNLQKLLTISLQAEERFIKLTEEIKQLIKEDQLAKSDIEQPIAQIERQRLISIQLRQDLYAAIQTLKLTMGDVDLCARDPDQLIATDEYPALDRDDPDIKSIAMDLIHYATSNRYNIRASEMRQLAINALLKGAYNQVLPQVNLRAGVRSFDYRRKGSAEPILKPLKLKNPETDWHVGLHVSAPLYNDAAEGALKVRQSQMGQAMLRTQLIIQTTISDLREVIANQSSLVGQLKKANELVLLNQTLIRDERKKLTEGFSTLFVLLDFEDRLTRSLSDQATISAQILQNVARIRFLTGTLLQIDDCYYHIEVADITTMPVLCKGD